MRWSLPLLLIAVLSAALPVQAQPSPVANTPIPGADLLLSGGAEPDTTAPWRYFPLHVGDAWEYYSYATGERRRVDVLGEETIDGRHYFTWRSRTYDADGNRVNGWGPRPIRFDTASAVVRTYVIEIGEESRFPLPWTPCSLDVFFGHTILCGDRKLPFEVGGDYDGTLAFGGEFPGTGTDTVRTSVKTYYSFDPGNTLDYRYAADIGVVFFEGELGAEGIYYARVSGVEYGQAFYPVADELGPPEPEALALSVFPNPFRERLTVTLDLPQAGAATLEVIDVLGRVVRRRDLGVLPAGRHEVRLRTADLAAGPYLVRFVAGESLRTTRTVTRLR